ncbi:MAG: hypothetical protein KC442_21405 [Thermomicrobiales bacterium]|nr:hypothetical protein [Thermomicrobiales bacterium]
MTATFPYPRRLSSVALPLVIAALTLAAPGATAQTPVTSDAASHPVHVHLGTCAELGEVVAPLNDLVPPAGDWTGPASAVPVTLSENVIDMPLQQIIDGGHAINVHLSTDAIDQYIACGDIGGVITTDEGGRREMMIGLAELNDSGYAGTVWLGPSADDTQTEISVILLEPAALP